MSDKAFVPLDFPAWTKWGQRGGWQMDHSAFRAAFPDQRHQVRDGVEIHRARNGTDTYEWPKWKWVGAVRHCGWCGRECPKRRRSWCSDTCSEKFSRVWSWRELAKYIAERDGGKCRRCGSDDGGPIHGPRYSGWQVDHITPVRNGGTDDPANLRLLCHDCHVAVGYEQRAAERPPEAPPAQLELDGAA